MNSYDSSQTWHEKFTVTFNDLCSENTDIILFHMAAHYHTDEYRIIPGPNAVLLNPSISPVHTNNPGFRQFFIDNNGDIRNYIQYFTDLPKSNKNEVFTYILNIIFVLQVLILIYK